jgi:hypothetical protein
MKNGVDTVHFRDKSLATHFAIPSALRLAELKKRMMAFMIIAVTIMNLQAQRNRDEILDDYVAEHGTLYIANADLLNDDMAFAAEVRELVNLYVDRYGKTVGKQLREIKEHCHIIAEDNPHYKGKKAKIKECTEALYEGSVNELKARGYIPLTEKDKKEIDDYRLLGPDDIKNH